MKQLTLPAATRFSGAIRLPGSKSLSNRSLLLASLAKGDTLIRNLLDSDDTHHMLTTLAQLGVRIERQGNSCDYRVHGVNGHFPVREAALFLGNAGTAFRPLTAVLALAQGYYQLSGVARMHERPVADLVDALRTIGANIHYLKTPGYPPLQIVPATIDTSGTISVRGNVSSQFLTALMMALPLTGQQATVTVDGPLISKPYIDITLTLMQRFGVTITHHPPKHFILPAGASYHSPTEVVLEADASSASYFLAAGVIAGGPVRVDGVGRNSIQGDIRFADILAQMGATIRIGDNWIEAYHTGKLVAIDVDLNDIPDAAMTVAIVALAAQGTTTIRNIESWRVKETDRLAAMANELGKLGATVEQGQDFIRITPPRKLFANVAIDTYDDHRMAMCFSLVSLMNTPITINDPGCVSKTFPTYFDEFDRLREGP